jgi:YidC/Oxa1 family membrane protein insertase
MSDIFYTIIIFPLVQIIELCYLFIYMLFNNPGAALLGVGMAVSVFTLPLYLRAETWQKTEREIQKRMAPKIAKIKAVFSGDEQYMVLSAYYRQNHYHPVYAMRNTFGLLIQIPFFIAAYSYLSHLEVLKGTPFLFIRDLGAADALLSISSGTVGINILPVVMTTINCISAAFYTKGLAVKDKVQLYGMALVFLVLLYNSPAGLVLYWTMNNIFSLLKNILARVKHAKKWVYGLLFTGAAFLDVYVLFFHSGYLPKRLFAFGVFSTIFFIPLFAKIPSLVARKFANRRIGSGEKTRKSVVNTVYTPAISGKSIGGGGIISLGIFVLLTGLVIPSSLIASSVEEFSFIEAHTSPFPFILHTLLQTLGIFIFWPVCIYLLFSSRTRKILSLGIIVLSFGAFFNVFLSNENFGFLTNALIFSEPKSFAAGSMKDYLINLTILAAVTAVVLYLILTKKKMLLFSFQIITFISLLCFGILNIIKIHDGYALLRDQGKVENTAEISTHYALSKTGKNVLLIMLDAAVSGYLPYIFEEKPELRSVFNDFTWYPNCVSFANHTLIGAPPIYGGYEYTPEEINRRDSVTLAEKHKEAYLLLPRLFSEAGYSVTVTDPPFSNYRMTNLSVFAEYPQIHAENLIGEYTSYWMNTRPDIQIQTVNITALLQNNLIRFSFFKMAPLFVRSFIYDDGAWLTTLDFSDAGNSGITLTKKFVDAYALMDLLPGLTAVVDTGNTYTAIYSPLPHEPMLLQAPDYIPSNNVANEENKRFANDNWYHVNIASFLLLEKFFRFLKDEGVYDNTRIILVADHGRGYSDYENNITLPDGSHLQSYHPLLMVKDFYSENEHFDDDLEDTALRADYSFMTNADAVFFALEDIMKDPVNPFTNQHLRTRKVSGVDIVTIDALSSYHHSKYKYNIDKNQWMHVHDNIFEAKNWSKVEK